MPESFNINVLVVDDSETVRFHLHSLLSEVGCHVRTATNGKEAMDALATYQADAIILDFNMPGMDGFEMLRTLQGDPNLREFPVYVLTGKTMNPSAKKMIEMEPNVKKVFTKPPQNVLFLDALRQRAMDLGKYKGDRTATIGGTDPKAPQTFEPGFRTLDLKDIKPKPFFKEEPFFKDDPPKDPNKP